MFDGRGERYMQRSDLWGWVNELAVLGCVCQSYIGGTSETVMLLVVVRRRIQNLYIIIPSFSMRMGVLPQIWLVRQEGLI